MVLLITNYIRVMPSLFSIGRRVHAGISNERENSTYTVRVMAGRPPSKEAPIFGQRLAALRKSKGMTQVQLAELLETTRAMVDYYERRATNPSLEFIERVAEALEVSVAELLGGELGATKRKPGPASRLRLRCEQIEMLPRKEQEFVLRFLDTVLERAQKV